MTLVPFVLGRRSAAARLAERCPVAGCVALDVYEERALFSLLLAGNAESYRSLAMPAWVMLDCAALPAGVIGFARPRAQVPPALFARLLTRASALVDPDALARLAQHEGLVPLAEYACVPTPEPGHVVGFSLFSLERGLGVRTKAMALAMHRARRQTGVAQVEGRALRAHTTIGPLDVVRAGVAAHERARTTIAYELTLDDTNRLSALARGARVERPPVSGALPLAVDEHTVGALEAMRTHGHVTIVDASETQLMVRAASVP